MLGALMTLAIVAAIATGPWPAAAGDDDVRRRVEARIERTFTPEFSEVVLRRVTVRDGRVTLRTHLRPEVDRARRISRSLCELFYGRRARPIPGVKSMRVVAFDDALLRRCRRR